MVKILAAADFHGSYEIVGRLAKRAVEENVDLVVIAGDIHGVREGEGKILDPFLKENKKVLFIPGNWDSTAEHERLREKAKSIHGYYVTYGDVAIAGIGSPDMRLSLDEDDFIQIKKQFEKMKAGKKVLVSHLHVRGSKAEFSGVKGDEFLKKAVDEFEPDILISSHIHESEGIEDRIGKTRVFQVGRRGKVFEI